ncbi:MAG: hypothetical protein KBG84_07830 [Planctomycetes bacterium]|nr:hypothetical protein [Planctomycetota bacterium]
MPNSILLELTRRYLEPHRRYHTLAHVAHMLHGAHEAAVSEGKILSDEQIYAVWFHDAIYDPRSHDNEEQSAELAVRLLNAHGWDKARIETVRKIVLDTKHHEPHVDASKAVIDADLQTLALPWDGYNKIGRMIREEYAHVTDEQWKQGRSSFFQTWLDRPRIYYTPWGAKLEKQARENLARTIAGEV